jgi:hypothetical protein
MSTHFGNLSRKSFVFNCLRGLGLIIILGGCQGNDRPSAGNWQTYRNDRFGFEFLYPGGWVASNPPENRDGIAFSNPENPDVEIRGWATADLGNLTKNITPSNFTTQQGLSGNLEIKIDAKLSSMRVTIVHNKIRYYCRGTSPSQQFDGYYQFFYYIASHFKVSSSS